VIEDERMGLKMFWIYCTSMYVFFHSTTFSTVFKKKNEWRSFRNGFAEGNILSISLTNLIILIRMLGF
jgi:hypothetical protein